MMMVRKKTISDEHIRNDNGKKTYDVRSVYMKYDVGSAYKK